MKTLTQTDRHAYAAPLFTPAVSHSLEVFNNNNNSVCVTLLTLTHTFHAYRTCHQHSTEPDLRCSQRSKCIHKFTYTSLHHTRPPCLVLRRVGRNAPPPPPTHTLTIWTAFSVIVSTTCSGYSSPPMAVEIQLELSMSPEAAMPHLHPGGAHPSDPRRHDRSWTPGRHSSTTARTPAQTTVDPGTPWLCGVPCLGRYLVRPWFVA